MTNEERIQAIEWLKRRPVMMAGAKRMDDLISRQAALDAAKHAWAKGLEPSQYIEIIPPIQPNHNAEPGKMVDDCISRQEAIDAVLNVIPHDEYWAEQVEKAIRSLPPVQQEITHEQAVDYLHKTGWLQNHDRILTESKVPLKGIWKDFTDEGYVECPFCKSATNCESKEEIDDLHFCFSCGAMLKRGKAE